MSIETQRDRARELIFTDDAFSRLDESDDAHYYARDRFVSHLDATALATVKHVIGTLVVEPRPVILDLMASWDSHIPGYLQPREVVGLGLNPNELEKNLALSRRVVHDLNRDPRLPFDDASFDVVLNTVSVDYVTRPLEVFAEAHRVLKPGGLFLVIFSNRMFMDKAVRLWREASEDERVMYVEDLFRYTSGFEPTKLLVSKGKRRPADDRYADTGLPSDPIYAVYADKAGGEPEMRRPRVTLTSGSSLDAAELRRREKLLPETLRCPYCGEKMLKWRVPDNPFAEWDTDHLYVCFNDECSYFVRGWEVMAAQGNLGFSYRMMYNPVSGLIGPVPVPNLRAMRDGILEE